jgi:hypothetical protein
MRRRRPGGRSRQPSAGLGRLAPDRGDLRLPVPDDAGRDAFAAVVRGRDAGRAFLAGAAFGEAGALAVAAFAGAAFAGAAFAGAALATAAFARAGGREAARRLGATVLFGAGAFEGAPFVEAAFAGAAAPAVSPARLASSFATAADALATWRCRRTSSARASLRSRSAFAIERSWRAFFAMVPPTRRSSARSSSPDDPIVEMMQVQD